ncbi:MAG: hypothetical protein GXY17_10925 [Clostridiaceae bacterium]|nr:hypothetical protein [Clostridiaceae bacterium]
MLGRKGKCKILEDKLDRVALGMERAKLNEYVNYLENPRKMFFANFMAGLARGFGASIGFTILAAVVIYILQGVVKLNLPIIGEFISDIVNIVNNNLKNTGR